VKNYDFSQTYELKKNRLLLQIKVVNITTKKPFEHCGMPAEGSDEKRCVRHDIFA
jgi:hypothetical protein